MKDTLGLSAVICSSDALTAGDPDLLRQDLSGGVSHAAVSPSEAVPFGTDLTGC